MRPWLMHDNGSVFYYVDVEIHTFEGKYVEQREPFNWDPTTEESFRVKSLDARSKLSDVDAPCVAPHVDAVRMVGGRSH